jgi:8-oxo-dGTP pyrophosphatase MutT (NUDIX family)
MHRNILLGQILNYKATDNETQTKSRFITFIKENKDCFERTLNIGHITASAFVVDKINKKILLIHHKKLNRWLQPGGHCDGNNDVLAVARKEVFEETGIYIKIKKTDVFFDLDIHTIPKHKTIKEHDHFDVRFLFAANSNLNLKSNEESNELKWIDVEKINEYTEEESILRMTKKVFY